MTAQELNEQSPWSTAPTLIYTAANLDPSIPHTLTMRNLEDKRLSIDRVVVTQDRNSGHTG